MLRCGFYEDAPAAYPGAADAPFRSLVAGGRRRGGGVRLWLVVVLVVVLVRVGLGLGLGLGLAREAAERDLDA
jgi:hypothetical protein